MLQPQHRIGVREVLFVSQCTGAAQACAQLGDLVAALATGNGHPHLGL